MAGAGSERQTGGDKGHSNVLRRLSALYLDPAIRITVILSAAGFTGLTVLTFLLGSGVLAVLFLLLALLSSAIAFGSWYAFKKKATKQLEEMIWSDLRKEGIEKFDLSRVIQDISLPWGAQREATEAVYETAVEKAAADLKETSKERESLDRLQRKLGLEPKTARRIEENVKGRAYSEQVEKRLVDDGKLDEYEEKELKRIRKALRLDTQEAFRGAGKSFRKRYKDLFQRFIEDGHLSDDEMEQLQRFRNATGLPAQEAARITRKEAMDLYRRTVHMICQDGKVTEQERKELKTLKEVLGLQEEHVAHLDQKVEETAELERIRNGHLPETSPPSGLILDGAETCHWHANSCVYRRLTAAGNEKKHDGSLVVTSKRFWFRSPEYPVEFKPKKIMNLRVSPQRLEVELTRKKGQGVYQMQHAKKVGAVLHSLARGIVAASSESSRGRHIPDHVKVKVWRRDGGQCVNCGAEEPLEYDHIIPFSKGGSNRPRNIQLLCARCNRAKSADIGGAPAK